MSKARPVGAGVGAAGGPGARGGAAANNLRGRGGPPASGNSVASSASSASSAASAASAAHNRRGAAAAARPGWDNGDNGAQPAGLKIVNGDQEFALLDSKVTIGRRKECDICLSDDPLVSGNHCEITNGFVLDAGSTNGTLLNGAPLKAGLKKMLKGGDKLQVGDRILRIEVGVPRSAGGDDGGQHLSRSKKFIGGIDSGAKDGEDASAAAAGSSSSKESDEDAKLSVEELMDKEFAKIIGHDGLKKQLRQFYKKVQLDQIRIKAGKEKDVKRLYHMIFSGPPGTGKTTMANLVAKIMLKMKLVSSDKVVFVNNALELLGSYVGQTPAKVDAKVAEAKGGILFVDEAYSVVKGGGDRDSNGGQFGREAIDTLMKHLDPPSAVFIFAGYEKPMEDFLRMNEGLARRIPYRYQFDAYTVEQLCQIFNVMCDSKGEVLESGVSSGDIGGLLASIDPVMLSTQNAGLVQNWLSFAQGERDDRVDIDEALANPDLASTLALADLTAALVRVKEMKSAAPPPSGPAGSPLGIMMMKGEPELQYAEQ